MNTFSTFHFNSKSSWTLLLSMSISFFFNGCSDKCQVTSDYWYYEPVYATTDEIKAATGLQDARNISHPGRIYYKDHVLFINESGKGIHIIDNHDPKTPQPLAFLNIPGNFDLAIYGNTLYADSFSDLVVFDITDLTTIKEIKRVDRLFNHYHPMIHVTDGSNNVDYKLVIDWKPVRQITMEESDCERLLQPWGGMFFEDGIALRNSAAAHSTQVPQ
jgi:hypothetical protein